jgi:hypothetical protein
MELKKKIAGGTTKLFRNEFKYTTETKKSNILLERKSLKIWSGGQVYYIALNIVTVGQ